MEIDGILNYFFESNTLGIQNGSCFYDLANFLHFETPSNHDNSLSQSSIVPKSNLGFFLIDLLGLKIICWEKRCMVIELCTSISKDGCQRKQGHAGNALLAEVFTRNLSKALQNKDDRLKCCIFDKSWHLKLISRFDQSVSFEMLVLDNALFAVIGKFNRHLTVVKPIYKILHQETVKKPSDKIMRRILALKKSLLSFLSNVKSVSDTFEMKIDISELNLSSKENHEVAFGVIVEGYKCDLVEIQREIQSMLVQIEETEEYISLQINEARNKIIRLSLNLEISMLGLTLGACIGSLFGMNLSSGLEENPNAFLTTVIIILMLSISVVCFLVWRSTSIMFLEYNSHQFTFLRNFFKYIDFVEVLKMKKDKSEKSKFSFGEQLMREINKEISPEDADLIHLIFDGENIMKDYKKN